MGCVFFAFTEQSMTVPGENPAPPAGETPANPPVTPAAAPASEMLDGQPFDAERARRLIETQRESERALKAKLKELEPLAAKARELEDANKSELEKAQAKAAAAEQRAEQAEAARRSALINSAVMAEANAQGANPDAIKRGTIARLVDISAIELDDSGEVKGADKAVKALLEAEPYLKAAPANGSAGPNPTPKGSGPLTREQRIGDIAARMRQGPFPRL
jgi:hypothetical protein